jgi:hypothetical protein
MPRDGTGTFSLVAGNPVLPATLIESNWANTTLTDVAQALTDSLSRNGNGGMLVPFKFANGTMGAPSITFTNQQNTGVYWAGISDLRVTVQAQDVSRWTATTLQVFSTGAFRNVAHSTAAFDAQVVLANSFLYLAPVVAEGTELFFGIDGRTNDTAEAALKLADTALQAGDNVSELANDAGYAVANNIPPATETLYGGFKYTLVGDVLTITV